MCIYLYLPLKLLFCKTKILHKMHFNLLKITDVVQLTQTVLTATNIYWALYCAKHTIP